MAVDGVACLLNAFRLHGVGAVPVAAPATRHWHPAAMANLRMDRASLEAKAVSQLQQAVELERDTSGTWRTRARRRQSAQRLRAAASGHQRAASRLEGLDLPEDLPF